MISKFLQYYNFAASFGWTPEQVDGMDEEVKRGLLCIMEGIAEGKDG